MGKFVISKRKNGEFQFNLLAANGQVILTSEGYASKPSCMNGVKSVMKNAADTKRFEPKVAKNGKFHFNLKAGNGQVILSSQGYAGKPTCLNGIESVRKNSQDDSKFERKESSSGKPYFNLKATNGQVIGNSEMYESVAACENGIESVKKNAPEATVEDQTV